MFGQIPIGFSTAQGAGEYIQGKIDAFRALGSRLLAMQHQAALVEAAARDVGNTDSQLRARDLREHIAETYREHGETMDKLDAIIAKVPGLGALPVIPVAIAASVIAVATSMAFIFGRSKEAEQQLDLIARGVLTPEEVARLERERGLSAGLFGGLANTARYAAIGIALYFGLPIVAKLFK